MNKNEFIYFRTLVQKESKFGGLGSLFGELPAPEVLDGGKINTIRAAVLKSDIVGFNETLEDIVPKDKRDSYTMISTENKHTYCANIEFDDLKEIMEKYYETK